MNIILNLDIESAELAVSAILDSANELVSCGDDGLAAIVREIANDIARQVQAAK